MQRLLLALLELQATDLGLPLQVLQAPREALVLLEQVGEGAALALVVIARLAQQTLALLAVQLGGGLLLLPQLAHFSARALEFLRRVGPAPPLGLDRRFLAGKPLARLGGLFLRAREFGGGEFALGDGFVEAELQLAAASLLGLDPRRVLRHQRQALGLRLLELRQHGWSAHLGGPSPRTRT